MMRAILCALCILPASAQTWHNQVAHKVGHVAIGFGTYYGFKRLGYPRLGLAITWGLAIGKEWRDERYGEPYNSRALDVGITALPATFSFKIQF